MFDLIIKNGKILSARKEPFFADIGIKGAKIIAIAKIKNSAKTIDAEGLLVGPGFIDMHSHSDFAVMKELPSLAKVSQGITSQVIGNCGISGAPYNKKSSSFLERYLKPIIGGESSSLGCSSWKNYLKVLNASSLATNILPLVGQGNSRAAVMGINQSSATKKQLKEMKDLLREVMEQGAWGFSTGLIYPPGIFTSTDELISLAKVISKFGGIYATHIRGEGETLIPAIEEALLIGEKAGVPIEISHLKAAGRENWHKTDEVLELISKKRDKGFDVTYDQYPYLAGSTTLTALLPPWMHQGGVEKMLLRLANRTERGKAKRDIENGIVGWENFVYSCGWEGIIISQVETEKNRKYEGRNVREISQGESKLPTDFIFDLLIEEKGKVNMLAFSMNEESVKKIGRENFGFVGTDGLPGRRPHPRLWGTFPKILRKWVREEKFLTLQEVVHKFSSGPAEKLNLKDRGEIKVGKIADIVIFDFNQVGDRATYEKPTLSAKGIKYVIVNGKIVIADEKFTGETRGELLLR